MSEPTSKRIAELEAERDEFHMAYRTKCDEETKRLHNENARLRAVVDAVWTQDLPSASGLYLRNNPPASAILFADVVEIDGVLRNVRVNSGDSSVSIESQKGFWWFGPIAALDAKKHGGG